MAQDFVHLHAHSDGSLLDGGNSIDRLVDRAADLGMKALAVTDHGVMFNSWAFHEAAKKRGLTPIIGMEAYMAPGHRGDREARTVRDKTASHLVLLAQNQEGYRNLVKLASIGFTEGFYYNPRIDRETLAAHSEGLIVSSACLAGEVAQQLEMGNEDEARRVIEWYRTTFPGRYFLEAQAHGSEGQAALNRHILRLSSEMDVPVIATTDAHFLERKDHEAHDCLICIGMGKDKQDPNRLRYDEGLYFQSGDEVKTFFGGRTDLLDQTCEIGERVKYGFSKRYHVPSFPVAAEQRTQLDAAVASQGGSRSVLSAKVLEDPELTESEIEQRAREIVLLRDLAQAGAERRYGSPLKPELQERLDYELGVISNAGYAGYHLIVADFIQASRDRGIAVGPGRGSAAGSLVCYSLGITNVDPIEYDLLFERFLNPDRVSMPDIDVDFSDARRGEVIDYVKEKYGHDAVCQIITFGTMKARAAIKDVGRTLGFTPKEMDEFAKLIPNGPAYSLTVREAVQKVPEVRAKYERDRRYRELCDLAMQIEGLKRHSSKHAAGVVIAPGPVSDYVPVAMVKGVAGGENVLVTQYDMNDVEKAGMLKMDFLGLSTLTVIEDTLKGITERDGTAPDLDRIPMDDAATYQLLARGQVSGVFQLESSLARDKLTAMKPDRIDDIIATNALLRPGPLDTGMTDNFIKRKRGEQEVDYPHPLLEETLKPTLGIIVYQEQIMRAAQVLAGYTLAEADVLRKAVGKKDAELIASELKRFKDRCVESGKVTRTQAEDIARLIETFGRYGFNKSHSAAYAIVAYQTAYLKAHYPTQFMAALLSSVSDKTDDVVRYLNEARDLQQQVLPPHVNESGIKFRAVRTRNAEGEEVEAIRFGLAGIKNVGEGAVEAILRAREDGPFADFFDFYHRVAASGRLNSRVLMALVHGGALDGLGPNRAAMAAVIEPLTKAVSKARQKVNAAAKKAAAKAAANPDQAGLFGGVEAAAPAAVEMPRLTVDWPDVPEKDARARLEDERLALGLYVSGHPLTSVAEFATAASSHQAADVRTYVPGQVRLAGVVTNVVEAVAKSSGKRWAKVGVEDLTGGVTCLCFPEAWEEAERLMKPGTFVVVQGTFADSDEDLDRAPDLRVQRVTGLMEVLSAGELAVVLRLSPEELRDPELQGRLREIFEEHEGNSQIIVDNGRSQRAASTRVNMSPAILRALRRTLGDDRVSVGRGVALYDEREAEMRNSRPRRR